MGTAKQEMVRIIENQPVDSSYEEILKELAFARMVARGLADSDAGRTISNEELQKRMASWQPPSESAPIHKQCFSQMQSSDPSG